MIYILLFWIASSLFIGYNAFTFGDYQCQKRNDLFFEIMNDKYLKQEEDSRARMEKDLEALKDWEERYRILSNESKTHYSNYLNQSVISQKRQNEVSLLQDMRSDLEKQVSALSYETKELSLELNRFVRNK